MFAYPMASCRNNDADLVLDRGRTTTLIQDGLRKGAPTAPNPSLIAALRAGGAATRPEERRMTTAQATIAKHLRWQADQCGRLGSPLYERLLLASAADVLAGGPCWAVLAGREADEPQSMPALRFLGAVHRLVLTGQAPALAPLYGSEPPAGDPWPAFRATVAEHVEALRAEVLRAVQTNEVGRSAALVGGFLLAARDTGLPLRVLELGASAGLNLRWDAFRYETESAAWGDPGSPVRLEGAYDGAAPPFEVAATVAERRGGGPHPPGPPTPG